MYTATVAYCNLEATNSLGRPIIKYIILACALAATSGVAAAAPPIVSPYAGQQARQIKSLSSDDISALKKGEGHGLARLGELNHYPGPRHVLAMAEHLNLTKAQQTSITAIYNRMHNAAVPLGLEIIAKEQQLDGLFAAGTITDGALNVMTSQIGALNARLRAVHLSSHIAVKRILTKEQTAMYDKMRGYDGNATHDMTNMKMRR